VASRAGGKSVCRGNPITFLLADIQTHPNPNVRISRLQTLLFFIDRHRPVLHGGLTRGVLSNLAQLLSHDGVALQPWAFMCLAAITHDNARSSLSTSSQSQIPSKLFTLLTRLQNGQCLGPDMDAGHTPDIRFHGFSDSLPIWPHTTHPRIFLPPTPPSSR
jgi:hypothetical protein